MKNYNSIFPNRFSFVGTLNNALDQVHHHKLR